MTLRLLNRRCGPLSEPTTAQIQALPLYQLEALAAHISTAGSGTLRRTMRWPVALATTVLPIADQRP